MKKFGVLAVAVFVAISVLLSGLAPAAAAQPSGDSQSSAATAFIHVADLSNTVSNWSDIDNPATNGNPNAVLIVTQNWNPYEVYNAHAVGVFYDSGKWAIFNEDGADMPFHAAFNVLVLRANKNAFVHTATARNSRDNWTNISKSTTNKKPSVLLQVTPNWAPHEVYDASPIGVWYNVKSWSIFNQDLSSMPRNAAFNVQVLKARGSSFIQIAGVANTDSQVTYIDDPATNGNTGAKLFVTPNWKPTEVYDNHPIGVYYDTFYSKWAVFNQDLADMPDGSAFNVYVVN